MHITLVLVASINGKITRGNDPDIYKWTSVEDQKHFFGLIEKYSLIVMGRKTYEVGKPRMKHIPSRLRIVYTKNPKQYKNEEIPNQLLFTNEPPDELISKLERMKYKEMLLVGGSKLATLFLKQKLINTIMLTIEPYLFGSGTDIFEMFDDMVPVELTDCKQLNQKGTLLLTYRVSNS